MSQLIQQEQKLMNISYYGPHLLPSPSTHTTQSHNETTLLSLVADISPILSNTIGTKYIPRPILNSFPAQKGLNRGRIYWPWISYTEARGSIMVASLKPFSQWFPRFTLRFFPVPPTQFHSLPLH